MVVMRIAMIMRSGVDSDGSDVDVVIMRSGVDSDDNEKWCG